MCSHSTQKRSFTRKELKLHLYFLEAFQQPSARLIAHSAAKTTSKAELVGKERRSKQIPRNCGAPQWAQKVSRLPSKTFQKWENSAKTQREKILIL